jgi:hypothetical protein
VTEPKYERRSETQKDNSALTAKVNLRRQALTQLGTATPVICETNGGFGELFKACYLDVQDGIVFETSAEKSEALAKQRPTWAVYEADCIAALKAKVGSHLMVNFLDCDPYGDCIPIYRAFFSSRRPRAKRLVVVLHDGLRKTVRFNRAWSVESLQSVVQKYGNGELFRRYLDIAKELLCEAAEGQKYKLKASNGFYNGIFQDTTHLACAFEK